MKLLGVRLSTYLAAAVKVLGISWIVWGVFVEAGPYTGVAVAVMFALHLVDDFLQAAQGELNENLVRILKQHYD